LIYNFQEVRHLIKAGVLQACSISMEVGKCNQEQLPLKDYRKCNQWEELAVEPMVWSPTIIQLTNVVLGIHLA
jgi:hypothetical protein